LTVIDTVQRARAANEGYLSQLSGLDASIEFDEVRHDKCFIKLSSGVYRDVPHCIMCVSCTSILEWCY